MTFNAFLVLLTLGALVVGWVLHELLDRTDDGPSYWQTLIYPGRYPKPSYHWPFIIVFLVIGGIGAIYLS